MIGSARNEATVDNILEVVRSMDGVCDDIKKLIAEGKIGVEGKHDDALDEQVAFLMGQNKRRGLLLDILKANGGTLREAAR